MTTLDHQELLHAQLTFLALRDRTSYDRAVQAVEDRRIDGRDGCYCFYGMYANQEHLTNPDVRVYNAINLYMETEQQFCPPGRGITAIEVTVLDSIPSQSLSKKQQAFLALCKQVQMEVQSCSLQATRSEE